MCNSYDPFGRISQVTVDGIAAPFVCGYLSGTDLQRSLVMPNGVTRETVYEPCRDLTSSVVHTNAGGTVLTRRTFTRDASGNLTARTQYRLGDETNRVDVFSQNERGELVYAAFGTNGYAYAFDPIGNRLTTDEPGFSAVYFANSLNQYTRISNSVPPAEFVPEFDADGNQTLLKTATGIWHVSYNAENRPVVFSNDTAVVEMGYDYIGRRFEYKETVVGAVTRHERFLYRGYLRVAALDLLDGTNALHTIAWDPSELVATRPLALLRGTNWWSYGFDQVKNVTELFDASGVLAATYDYAPFGAVTASSGSVAAVNPLTFSSEIDDAALGLIQYTFRPLNTTDGRWCGKDLMDENGGLNLYACERNDLINNSDVFGLISIGNKIIARFGIRAMRSLTLAGRLFNSFTQGPETITDDEGEMNSALDYKIKQTLIYYIQRTGKEGTIIFNDVDLNRVYGQITYDKDTSNFKTGWWLNGAHKVIANGEARCVKRSGGRLSIGSINADLVWHDWIDANPSGENLVKHALETAFGVYDKFGYVGWEIRIPWSYQGDKQ